MPDRGCGGMSISLACLPSAGSTLETECFTLDTACCCVHFNREALAALCWMFLLLWRKSYHRGKVTDVCSLSASFDLHAGECPT
ncbi:hypothetical protein F2P79_001718 [Pimephales promelas]|nr:hypothetical protein F2P79_001718 [Pimephales promelas]